MSSKFDWRTEDDFDWDRLEETSPSELPPGRRRWLAVLIGVLLVAGLAAFLVRQVDQRIDENTQAISSDVISSHNLLRFAEKEQDDELFFSLLSGRDSTWTATQHKLFQSRTLHDRAPFGLKVLPSNPLPLEGDETLSVTFSPDLMTADVTTLLPYEITIGNQLTETVTLQETNQYRLGRERWLLSPLDEAFWGTQESQKGARLELTFPQRDSDLAVRLLPDLERKLEELCSTLADIDCSSGSQLKIFLSTDPQTLVDSAQPRAAQATDDGLTIVLPTPTLVGIPQDEAGYQAIFRGYAAQMVTAVISHDVGYECCEQLPIYRALVDYQLSQLALKPWPVGSAAYEQALSKQVSFQELSPLWPSDNAQDIDGPDGWRTYVLVDYLLDRLPQYSPALLQRELINRENYQEWLNSLFTGESNLSDSALINELARGFWLRSYARTLNNTADWGADAPAQDIYLTCAVPDPEDQDAQITTLYQYDIDQNRWDGVYETSSMLWTRSLPGDDMLLQQEFDAEGHHWTAGIRQNAHLIDLVAGSQDSTVAFGQTDPAATGLAAYLFPPGGNEATITWFDLRNCQESGGCSNQELPGIPIWSADGGRALFTGDPNSQLDLLRTELRTVLYGRPERNRALPWYIGTRAEFSEGEALASAEELPQVANGRAPIWLDNNTVAFVADDSDPMLQRGSRVMSTAVDQDDPQLLFSLSDLLAALDIDIDAQRMFWIQYLMLHPDKPEILYVVVLSAMNQRAYVLSFDRSSDDVRYLMSAGWLANHSLGISPDGRYLILTGMDESDPNAGTENTLLQLYDLAREEVIPFFSLTGDFPPFSIFYDWSQDGSWLAILLDDDKVGFYSPEAKQLQIVETPPGACGAPSWINQQR